MSNLPKSIYDFHDDSEREEDCLGLSIDESPKRSKKVISQKNSGKNSYQCIIKIYFTYEF